MRDDESIFSMILDSATRGKLELLAQSCDRSKGSIVRELINIAADRHIAREGQRGRKNEQRKVNQ
jgi:predicted transcriptional regulator